MVDTYDVRRLIYYIDMDDICIDMDDIHVC